MQLNKYVVKKWFGLQKGRTFVCGERTFMFQTKIESFYQDTDYGRSATCVSGLQWRADPVRFWAFCTIRLSLHSSALTSLPGDE